MMQSTFFHQKCSLSMLLQYLTQTRACINLLKNLLVVRNVSSYTIQPAVRSVGIGSSQTYGNKCLLKIESRLKVLSATTQASRDFHVSPRRSEKSGDEENNDKDRNKASFAIFAVTAIIYFLSVRLFRSNPTNHEEPHDGDGSQIKRQTSVTMTWQEFLDHVLPTGEVKKVTVWSDHTALVTLHTNAMFMGRKVKFVRIEGMKSTSDLEERLRNAESLLKINPADGIPVEGIEKTEFLFSGWELFIILACLYLVSQLGKFSGTSVKSMYLLFNEVSNITKQTNVKFADVAGMKEAKQEVMEFVDFLKKPERYERLGAKMPRGCLLTGPPGVGKTLLAKAVASEANVPFIAKAGSDFVELIGGLGARRMRSLFKQARESAPCIIYIDELDAVGSARVDKGGGIGGGSGEKDQTLNQLLVEMDGMLSKKHQVIILASTNRSDILDKALLRPGRFDRVIQIDLPNRLEREEILLCHLSNIKLSERPETFAPKLASLTTGMSGADLANVCNESAIYAARNGDGEVTHKHIDYAVERVIAGAPKSATSVSPEEKNVVAIHESGHALIGWLLEHTDALAKVTIIPRTKAALGFARTVPSDRHLHTQEQLSDYMCMALGGRAAEDLVLGRYTQGAQDDLKKVTDMAYAQVKYFGFSEKIGPLSFRSEGYTSPFSDFLSNMMDVEVRELVKKSYDRAKNLLAENRSLLDSLSRELLRRESLNYDDVEKLIGPPVFADKKQTHNIPFGPFASDMEETKTE